MANLFNFFFKIENKNKQLNKSITKQKLLSTMIELNNNTCDCNTRENDVCPKCLDSTMDDIYQSMIDGTAGRNLVDMQINIKELLITIITNPEFVRKTQNEIKALKILRERQQTD